MHLLPPTRPRHFLSMTLKWSLLRYGVHDGFHIAAFTRRISKPFWPRMNCSRGYACRVRLRACAINFARWELARPRQFRKYALRLSLISTAKISESLLEASDQSHCVVIARKPRFARGRITLHPWPLN